VKSTDIPQSSRSAVRDRDGQRCRLCGQFYEHPEVHHIAFRSQERNNHDPSNLISLCYRCHRIAHTYASLVRPALQGVLAQPWLTGFQWLRQHGHDIAGLARGTL